MPGTTGAAENQDGYAEKLVETNGKRTSMVG